jgi:hypothetical protein
MGSQRGLRGLADGYRYNNKGAILEAELRTLAGGTCPNGLRLTECIRVSEEGALVGPKVRIIKGIPVPVPLVC